MQQYMEASWYLWWLDCVHPLHSDEENTVEFFYGKRVLTFRVSKIDSYTSRRSLFSGVRNVCGGLGVRHVRLRRTFLNRRSMQYNTSLYLPLYVEITSMLLISVPRFVV